MSKWTTQMNEDIKHTAELLAEKSYTNCVVVKI